MNKWFHALGLMLLVTLVCDLSGCAQTNGWLARKPSKKNDSEKLADADKKSTDKSKLKSAKPKSARELADARAAKSKTNDVPTAKAKPGLEKSKAVDAEHEKYAAADRMKRKKATDSADTEAKSALAANTKADKPKKPAARIESPKTDEELDNMFATVETPSTPAKKKASSGDSFEDIIAEADTAPSARKNVVQVKKEVAKGDTDNDVPDWADSGSSTPSKNVKSANVAENFEDELESPFELKEKTQTRDSKKSAVAEKPAESKDDDANEFAPPTKRKVSVGKSDRSDRDDSGLVAQCPTAGPELRDLLKQIDPQNNESLRQGLYRIGQMGRDGEAAIAVLRKMLKHEDGFVRAHAALAMARLGLTSPETDVVVIEIVKSRDTNLRSFGVSILGEMGPQASDVLAKLAESMNDRDGQMRLRVAEILILHEQYETAALSTLLACLKDKDENVRWLTTYSLAELAPEDSPETVQALIKAASDRAPRVQAGAIYALGEIGPSAKRANEELRRLKSATSDEELKKAIDYALKQINP